MSPLYNQQSSPTVRRVLALLEWSIKQDLRKPGDGRLSDREAAIAGGQLVMADALRAEILHECKTGEFRMAVPEEKETGEAE